MSRDSLAEYSVEQLQAERRRIQAKIDGPENDGRLSASSSMTLDHWFDLVELLDDEIGRRKEADAQTEQAIGAPGLDDSSSMAP